MTLVPFAGFSYRTVTVQTDQADTVGSVEEKIRRAVRNQQDKEDPASAVSRCEDSLRIVLEGGFTHAGRLDPKRLWNAGRILEITDHTGTVPDYEALVRQYPGTLLEAYIQTLGARTDEAGRIALEEGTRALLAHIR